MTEMPCRAPGVSFHNKICVKHVGMLLQVPGMSVESVLVAGDVFVTC